MPKPSLDDFVAELDAHFERELNAAISRTLDVGWQRPAAPVCDDPECECRPAIETVTPLWGMNYQGLEPSLVTWIDGHIIRTGSDLSSWWTNLLISMQANNLLRDKYI